MRTPNPVNIAAIDHIVLTTTQPEKMLHFYVDVLGCKPERQAESLGLIQMRAGNALIDLLINDESCGDKCHNTDHFCLRLAPWDEALILAHLDAHQISYSDVAVRYGANGRGSAVYIADPEGNTVELRQ